MQNQKRNNSALESKSCLYCSGFQDLMWVHTEMWWGAWQKCILYSSPGLPFSEDQRQDPICWCNEAPFFIFLNWRKEIVQFPKSVISEVWMWNPETYLFVEMHSCPSWAHLWLVWFFPPALSRGCSLWWRKQEEEREREKRGQNSLPSLGHMFCYSIPYMGLLTINRHQC